MPKEKEIVPPDPQSDAEREDRIRKRAYQLWQQHGAPEGRAEEYWHRARQLIDEETSSTSNGRRDS
jgi:hypothetical protein